MESLVGIIILLAIVAIVIVVVMLHGRFKRKKAEEMKAKYDAIIAKYKLKGLPVVNLGSLNLAKEEICHFSGNACSCKIKQEIVGYKGGSRGISIRIVKGVSFRVGNFKGHSVKKQIIDRNTGIIYLTNKKIIFSAKKNSAVINLRDIVALNSFKKILQIQTNSKSYLYDIEDIFSFLVILECLFNKEEPDLSN